MKTLLHTYQRYFILYTGLLLIACAPLFYWVMEWCYAEDLDELIEYRLDDFKHNHLNKLHPDEIETWNKYNYDLMILPFDSTLQLDRPQLIPYYNPAEGYEVGYRSLHSLITIADQPYILRSRIAMVEPEDLLITLIYEYGLLILIFFASILLIQKFLAKKLWAPFYHTLNQIENYNLEKGHVPVFKSTKTLEFNRLNNNLQHLIENNIAVYKQQKVFIENASHELQTPLAVFRSQLDLLLQDEDLTQKQMHLLQSLYNVSSRFNRLNKNLLLLAKLESNQFQKNEKINLSDLLQQQLGFFEDLAHEHTLTVETAITPALVLEGNLTLVESLVSNLLSNAFKYAPEDGRITVELTPSHLTIANTGGVALNPATIFLRFNRATEEKNGTGLGLSIVHEISKLHQWIITYTYSEHLHAFTVHFTSKQP